MICIVLASILLLFASIAPSYGQNLGESFSNSAAYAEVGVVGLFGSLAGLNVSYEHRLYSNADNNLHIYGRGGVAAAGVLFGSGGNDVFFQPMLEAGYRYQQPQGSFLFKAKGGITGFGIALGYAF